MQLNKLEIIPEMAEVKDRKYISNVKEAIVPLWEIAEVHRLLAVCWLYQTLSYLLILFVYYPSFLDQEGISLLEGSTGENQCLW